MSGSMWILIIALSPLLLICAILALTLLFYFIGLLIAPIMCIAETIRGCWQSHKK